MAPLRVAGYYSKPVYESFTEGFETHDRQTRTLAGGTASLVTASAPPRLRTKGTEVVQAHHDQKAGTATRCGPGGHGCGYRHVPLFLRLQRELRGRTGEKGTRIGAAATTEQIRRDGVSRTTAPPVAQRHRNLRWRAARA